MDSLVSSSPPPRLLPEGILFTLKDEHLWEEIVKKDTNQVSVVKPNASENGRRLFPGMQFKVGGLNPEKQYKVFIRFASKGAIWQRSGDQWCQTTFSKKPYVTEMLEHEDGLQTGEKWSSEGIDFRNIVFCASEYPGRVRLPTRCQFEPILYLFELNTRTNEMRLLKEEGFPLCRFITTSTETESFKKLKSQMKQFNHIVTNPRSLKRRSSGSKGSRSSFFLSNGFCTTSPRAFNLGRTCYPTVAWQGPSLSFPATSVPLAPYPSLASFLAPYTSMTTAQTPIYTTHPLPFQSFSLNPLALPYVSLLNLIAPSQASQAAESLPPVLEKEDEEQDENSVPVNFKSVDSLI